MGRMIDLNTSFDNIGSVAAEMTSRQLTLKEIGDWDSSQSRLPPISKSLPPPNAIDITGKKHGHINTKIYRTWSHIKGRCNNPTDKAYENYGGRGIEVCAEWEDLLMRIETNSETPEKRKK